MNFTDEKEIEERQKSLANAREITTTLSVCPKCAGHHEDLVFHILKQPVSDGSGNTITHTSECPTTQLQLRLGWKSPEVIAGRERAAQMSLIKDQLKVEDMDPEDVARVLDALREAGA